MYKINSYKTNEIINLKSKEIQQKITITNARYKNNKKGNTSKKKRLHEVSILSPLALISGP